MSLSAPAGSATGDVAVVQEIWGRDIPFTLKALHHGRELCNAYSATEMIVEFTQGRLFDELRANRWATV